MKPVYTHRLEVRWGDMDAVGHVNNATYLTYFEQARIGWFDSVEVVAMNRSRGPVMANVTCEYRRAIVYPAQLLVEVSVGTPGNSSLPTGYRIVDASDPSIEYAVGGSVLVWIDYTTGKAVPLPDAVRALAS